MSVVLEQERYIDLAERHSRDVPSYTLADLEGQYRVSSKLVAVNCGQILLGKLTGRLGRQWTLPGGGVEPQDRQAKDPYLHALWRETWEEGYDMPHLLESFDITDPLVLQPSFVIGADTDKGQLEDGRPALGVLKVCYTAESNESDKLCVIGPEKNTEIDTHSFFDQEQLPYFLHQHESGLVEALRPEGLARPVATIDGLPVFGPASGTLTLGSR